MPTIFHVSQKIIKQNERSTEKSSVGRKGFYRSLEPLNLLQGHPKLPLDVSAVLQFLLKPEVVAAKLRQLPFQLARRGIHDESTELLANMLVLFRQRG